MHVQPLHSGPFLACHARGNVVNILFVMMVYSLLRFCTLGCIFTHTPKEWCYAEYCEEYCFYAILDRRFQKLLKQTSLEAEIRLCKPTSQEVIKPR